MGRIWGPLFLALTDDWIGLVGRLEWLDGQWYLWNLGRFAFGKLVAMLEGHWGFVQAIGMHEFTGWTGRAGWGIEKVQ